jgi:hypothetical protein
MQAVTPQGDLVSQADRIGVTGALIAAVGVLWRALSKKDEAVLTATKSVTEALITAADSNRELRQIIEKSERTNQELKNSIETLQLGMGGLPCSRAHK